MSDHDDASEAASRVRLSLLWAIYLGAFGCIFPYLVLHLETVVGLSKGRIGTVMAVIPLAGIIAQPLWGAASDQSGRRREIMVLLSLGGAVCLVILGRAESFGTVLAVALFMSIFVTALVPLLTASTFAAMGTRSRAAFGSVRLWGTLGFLLGMECVGRIARLDPEAGLLWFGSARFLVIAAALILAGGLMMRSMPPVADLSLRSPRGAARRLLSDPGVRRILLFGFLANLAMQGPCQQLALILKAHGAEVRDVADTWRIPLVLEAVVIAFAWKLTQWLGPAGLVRLGLLAECIRWTASGLTDDLVMLQWLQLGHGISVTGILIGIPMLLERDVARELRSTAQALSASIGNGVGAVLSNLLLGWALDHFDDGVPLLVAGFLQGGLLLASLRWLR